MDIKDIKINDRVVYIPDDLLGKENMIKKENVGFVTSKNNKYVFVKYQNSAIPKATSADDLYSLKNRPDL